MYLSDVGAIHTISPCQTDQKSCTDECECKPILMRLLMRVFESLLKVHGEDLTVLDANTNRRTDICYACACG